MHESLNAHMCVFTRSYASVHGDECMRPIYTCTVMCTGLCANCFQMFEMEFVMQSTVSGIGFTAYRFLFIYLLCLLYLKCCYCFLAHVQCNGAVFSSSLLLSANSIVPFRSLSSSKHIAQ